jgi:hypothetical protein
MGKMARVGAGAAQKNDSTALIFLGENPNHLD